jgi:uncharacterized protein (DUF1778 family)
MSTTQTKKPNTGRELMTNTEVGELVREHERCEARLSELAALAYPSDEEQLEEIALKKKKLAIKGQMDSVMRRYEKSTKSAARLDVRLNAQVKEKIEQVAVASHQTVTDFVVTSLLSTSEDALKRHHAIRLTNRDRDLFLAAFDKEASPNRALRKAAKKFKRHSR